MVDSGDSCGKMSLCFNATELNTQMVKVAFFSFFCTFYHNNNLKKNV